MLEDIGVDGVGRRGGVQAEEDIGVTTVLGAGEFRPRRTLARWMGVVWERRCLWMGIVSWASDVGGATYGDCDCAVDV